MRMRAAVAVALLCAGCSATGADRPFTPADGPAPADASGDGGANPARAPGPLSTPAVETIEAGPGMTVSIEWPAGLDGPKQAMVKAFADGYVNSWKAVVSQGKESSYLGGVEDQAGRDAYTWVRGFVDRGESATGTAKVYAMRVASVTGRGAEVDACVDESGVQVTESGTGRPVASQPAWTRKPTSVYLQVAAVRQGEDGAWRVRTYMHATYPHQRAKECHR